MKITIMLLTCCSMLTSVHADQNTVNQLLNDYSKQGAVNPSIQLGKELWVKEFKSKKDGSVRSCSTCHTSDLTTSGKHLRTGKAISPMSPSINLKRLSSRKKVEKWFKRNCKWTLGRECSAQEKMNFTVYINTSNQIKF